MPASSQIAEAIRAKARGDAALCHVFRSPQRDLWYWEGYSNSLLLSRLLEHGVVKFHEYTEHYESVYSVEFEKTWEELEAQCAARS